EALGDVHRVDAVASLNGVAENDFVHGRQGIGQVENAFEMFADVVGIEHGIFGCLADARAVGEDVGERADKDAEVSAEGADLADGRGTNDFKRELASIFFYENGNWTERLKDLLHGDRAGARAASTVRRAEGFVQVEGHDVHAEIVGSSDSSKGVHVGAVHVEQRAFGVEYVGDLRDAFFENAER